VAILIFDALGFESYFRGTLQNFIVKRITNKKYRSGGVFLAAACDSVIHLLSLNPLWVVTTFIADSVWGLTFYKTRDLTSSAASHLIWDIVIFIVAPIK
jgi:membrane protease YdiL (CAAX protease family)